MRYAVANASYKIGYKIGDRTASNIRTKPLAIIKPVSRSEKSTMSITLDLPPKIEALLRQRAQSTGQDISQMAIAVLTLGLSLDDNDFFEALKGIQRGLDDFEQGQFSSLEDFIADLHHLLKTTLLNLDNH